MKVFLAKPKEIPTQQVFRAPKITINFDILKSDKLKELELLPEVEKEFNYTARTATGGQKTGRIVASSPEKATQILTELGLLNITLEEVKGGRSEPFKPYYEVKKSETTKKTKK